MDMAFEHGYAIGVLDNIEHCMCNENLSDEVKLALIEEYLRVWEERKEK